MAGKITDLDRNLHPLANADAGFDHASFIGIKSGSKSNCFYLYLDMSKISDFINVDQNIQFGKPVFKGTNLILSSRLKGEIFFEAMCFFYQLKSRFK